MWDIQAFYDSMKIDETIKRMEENDAPRRATLMTLMIHKAPRAVKLENSYAKEITQTGTSVLAGCPTATSLARGYMMKIAKVTESKEGVVTNQHVDDWSHGMATQNDEDTVEKAEEIASEVGREIKNAGLEVANKRGGAEVVSSKEGLAEKVARRLRAGGLPFRAARAVEDLSVGSKAGGGREDNTIRKRIAKAKARGVKMKMLRKMEEKAKHHEDEPGTKHGVRGNGARNRGEGDE